MLKPEITTYKDKICEKHNDFIWGDFVSDESVTEVVNFYRHQQFLPFIEGQVQLSGESHTNKEFKDSRDLHVPFQAAVMNCEKYLVELQRILELYMDRFPFCELSDFRIVEPLSIQWYPKGGGFKLWHTERSNCLPSNVYRHLVYMTYLNDVPDGGTEWFHQDKYIPAQKGYTVIWPSDWTHFHRGRVSETKEKMIITGWFSFQ